MDRLEGMSKLTGEERYTDDLELEGFLWGMTVRSPSPRGTIRGIRFDDSFDFSSCVVVTADDIPGPNEVRLIEVDQPVLASKIVRHVHEPVLLIAHESRDVVRRAVRAVEVVVDEQEPVLDYRKDPNPNQIQHSTDNILKRLEITKGDVDAVFRDADHVVEGIYETGAQEHLYLETQGMIAWVDADGVVTVKGSMQCPYYVLNSLKHTFACDESRVRVIQAPTGGGFGGKEDYPSMIALHAALLAVKAGRPVKMIYDRNEDMASTTKRHPAHVSYRTAHDSDGRLLAQDIDVRLDGGAYVTLSPVVLSRAIIHAGGPYACDHVRIRGVAMLSNSVPYGAFRGFGAPQTLFATERHMDRAADQLGIDPVQIRMVNLIRDGQTTSTGQLINDGTDRQKVLQQALDHADYQNKRKENRAFNLTHPFRRRGIGVAMFYHGAGFTGSGEVYLESKVRVAGLPDGRIEVLSANTEMGQGALTVFTQIASAAVGYEPDNIVIAEPDTFRVPNSGPTVASRTTMVVGKLIERACEDLVRAVGGDTDTKGQSLRNAIKAWHRANPGAQLIGEATYTKPPGIDWNEQTYKGDAYGTFAWAAYIADVEVDLRTCQTTVRDFVACQEVGRVINPTLATGQIQGGVVQAIGWALSEECIWDRGAMANAQMTNYIIPTSGDVPPIRVLFDENPYEYGAQGSKGIGELPMDGPAPAIANAIAAATGSDVCRIPITPERLMANMGLCDVE